MTGPNFTIKRFFDLALSVPLLVATCPLQLIVAAGIKMSEEGPVLFRQSRPGLDGREFTLIKFRTMRIMDDSAVHLNDGARITKLGKILRETSVDELPSLWNVVRGEMSLVGPRPLLADYLPLYSKEQARRHEVRPGLTGLAQVAGRNGLSWQDKLALDVEYVDTHSMTKDIRIILATIGLVLSRRNVSAPGQATMPKFTGDQG